jgi:serpin B
MNSHTVDDVAAALRAGELSIPFAAELFGRVAAAAKEDANVFVSPYSIVTALAIALEGARGDTAAQLKKAIGYGPDHDAQKLHHDILSLLQAVRCSSSSSSPCKRCVTNLL